MAWWLTEVYEPLCDHPWWSTLFADWPWLVAWGWLSCYRSNSSAQWVRMVKRQQNDNHNLTPQCEALLYSAIRHTRAEHGSWSGLCTVQSSPFSSSFFFFWLRLSFWFWNKDIARARERNADTRPCKTQDTHTHNRTNISFHQLLGYGEKIKQHALLDKWWLVESLKRVFRQTSVWLQEHHTST